LRSEVLARSWQRGCSPAFLFGVSPLDPPTIGGVAIFVVLTALTACYLATRTARIDTVSLLC
jgi:hypothetical protein